MKEEKNLQYVLCVITLLIGAGLTRGYLIISLYNSFSPGKPETWTVGTAVNFVLAGFLTYMLSFIFRIAIAYFALKQQSEKISGAKEPGRTESAEITGAAAFFV